MVNLEHVRLLLEARNPAARDARQALALIELLLPKDEQELTTAHLPFRVLQVDALEALGRREDAQRLLKQLASKFHGDPEVVRRQLQLAPR
jgi:hypothetical protein